MSLAEKDLLYKKHKNLTWQQIFLPFNTFSHQNLKINSHLFKLLQKCTEEIILSVQKFSSSRLFGPHIPGRAVQVNVNVL